MPKTCPRCKLSLSEEMFGKDMQRKTGLKSWCKPCRSEDSRRYRQDPSVRAKLNARSSAFGRKHHNTRTCVVASCDRLNNLNWQYCNAHGLRVTQYGDPREDIPVGSGTRMFPNERCWVYEARDSSGVLRYVGITGSPNRRKSEHKGRSWWFSQIETWQWRQFPSVTEALAEESLLIEENHRTIYNRQQMPEGVLV